MWTFLAVCAAICMPGIRAVLQDVFAQLVICFVNWLPMVIVATLVCFVYAVAIELRRPRRECECECATSRNEPEEETQAAEMADPVAIKMRSLHSQKTALPSALCACCGIATMSAHSYRSGSSRSASSWVASLLVLHSLLPPVLAANTTVPFTLADDPTSLASLKASLTTCNYAKTKECISNPTSRPEFGVYKRAPGHCVVFDSAYVNVTSVAAAIPGRYMPIEVKDAYSRGFANKFSEWSALNRQQFPQDCPLLYNETIAKGDDYLCCTESQYEQLKTQVRIIPGLCSSCRENLRNVWCESTCNPNNSMFLEVEQVRLLPGDANHPGAVFPAIEEQKYYVAKDWIRDIYDFCNKDTSVFAFLCNANQNCTDGYGLLNFMGEYKFNSLGSPMQTTFKTIDQYSPKEQEEMFCTCGNSTNCIHPPDVHLTSCAGVCGSLCAVNANERRSYTDACLGAVTTYSGTSDTAKTDSKWSALSAFMADNLQTADFAVLNYSLAMIGGLLALLLMVGFLYMACRQRKYGTAEDSIAAVPLSSGGTQAEARLSWVDDTMTKQLQRWGGFVATGRHPFLVLGVALALVVVASSGLAKIEIETDPVKLWVAESSRSFKERDRYGELFMPFYRTEQVVMVPKDGGSIGRQEYLKEAIRLQETLAAVTYGPSNGVYPDRVKLEDICWKATGTACTVNSITQYFQNRLDHFAFYEKYGLAMEHFRACLYSPQNADVDTCTTLSKKLTTGDAIPSSMGDCPCLSAYGAPMNMYNTYLGGFPEGAEDNTTLYLQSKALLSTSLVYNYYSREENMPAILWEREYIKTAEQLNADSTLFDIFYMAETSVQDEIENESNGNVLPVALSYSLMIIYVSLGINRWTKNKSFFHTSKMLVGFLGIFCIVLAVVSTIGLFMYGGAKLQLVIMEVVPFLTLAIGVDNIFLLVHAVSKAERELRAEQPALFAELCSKESAEQATQAVMTRAVGYIGPSIFMASFAESIAFAFGCISPMPAVLWFAAFSAVAVFLNFCLQMTLLLSIITLDKRRELSGKYDILLCFKPIPQQSEAAGAFPSPSAAPATPNVDGTALLSEPSSSGAHFFDGCIDKYATVLARPLVKLAVLLVFLVLTVLSIASTEDIKHGLRQADSLSSTSYLMPYFNAIDKYLATGAPVFFVVEAGYGRNPKVFDLTDQNVEAKFCKSKEFCDEYSVPNIINALSNDLDNKITHLSTGTMYSWMDDFWGFVNPNNECCRIQTNGSYMPIISSNATYSAARKQKTACMATTPPPVPEQSFMSLFSIFSTASAGALCSYGGGSIYRGQFSIDDKPIPILKDGAAQIVVNQTSYGSAITAFSYMATSTANPLQQDYIDGYKQARRAAEWISEKTGYDVWAYSLTYVFFDQYLTVVNDTYKFVGLALAAVFVIHAIYFHSFLYALAVTLGATNIVLMVMGVMAPNGIMLNGLSMVNLVIAAGISVEFCGHFVRMFAKARGSGDARAKEALRKVLSSVLFGITITKVVGLSALTLADSRIFFKYYFLMYMAVVVCGLLNGMLLLPVLLSVSVDVHQFWARRQDRAMKASEDPQDRMTDADNVDAPLSPSTTSFEPLPPTTKNSHSPKLSDRE